MEDKMNKNLKITLIIVSILILFIISFITIDTIQAKYYNHSPLIHTREYTSKHNKKYYIDKGIFVTHYNCSNIKETLFNNEKSTCIVEY